PSYSRGNALQQYAYVNGRPVRDKLIAGARRGAYIDALPRDRHAVAVPFLSLAPALVDVHVYPATAEVRFRDPGLVRGLIVGAIREALSRQGLRSATTGAAAMLDAFRAAAAPRPNGGHHTGWSAAASPSRPLEMGFAEGVQAVLEVGVGISGDARAGT